MVLSKKTNWVQFFENIVQNNDKYTPTQINFISNLLECKCHWLPSFCREISPYYTTSRVECFNDKIRNFIEHERKSLDSLSDAVRLLSELTIRQSVNRSNIVLSNILISEEDSSKIGVKFQKLLLQEYQKMLDNDNPKECNDTQSS
jgi:hypothetical protein